MRIQANKFDVWIIMLYERTQHYIYIFDECNAWQHTTGRLFYEGLLIVQLDRL